MLTTLTTHKQALENDLRATIQAFFKEHDDVPDTVSIKMELDEPEQERGDLLSIYIMLSYQDEEKHSHAVVT